MSTLVSMWCSNNMKYGRNTAGKFTSGNSGKQKPQISDIVKKLCLEGFVTRDARKVERKKVGLRKARKATQFSKR